MDMFKDQPRVIFILGYTQSDRSRPGSLPSSLLRLALQLELDGFEVFPSVDFPPSSDHLTARNELKLFLKRQLDAYQAKQVSSSRSPAETISPTPPNPTFFVHPGLSSWNESVHFYGCSTELGLVAVGPGSKIAHLFSNQLELLKVASKLKAPQSLPNLLVDEESFGLMGFESKLRTVLTRAKLGASSSCVIKSVDPRLEASIFVILDGSSLLGGDRTELQNLVCWLEQHQRNKPDTLFFIERYLESSRQISIPAFRFHGGETVFFRPIDSSLQNKNGIVLEYCPAPNLSASTQKRLEKASKTLLDHLGLIGFCRMRFLVDGEQIYFIGGRLGLDQSYPLIEIANEVQLGRIQMASLSHSQPVSLSAPKSSSQVEFLSPSGSEPVLLGRTTTKVHLRVVLSAEDPLLHLPQPGIIAEFEMAALPSLASDVFFLSHYQAHDVVPCGLHSISGFAQPRTVAEMYVTGVDVRKSMQCAKRALSQVWISGTIQTNERYLHELFAHPYLEKGIFHTGFLEEEFLPAFHPPQHQRKIATLWVSYLSSLSGQSTLGKARNDGATEFTVVPKGTERWIVSNFPLEIGPEDEWTCISSEIDFGRGVFTAKIQWASHFYRVSSSIQEGLKSIVWCVRVNESFFVIKPIIPQLKVVGAASELGDAALSPPSNPRKLRALTGGRVSALMFRPGTEAPAHQCVLLLESMGILVPHSLPMACKVSRWYVRAEDFVVRGQELAEIQI